MGGSSSGGNSASYSGIDTYLRSMIWMLIPRYRTYRSSGGCLGVASDSRTNHHQRASRPPASSAAEASAGAASPLLLQDPIAACRSCGAPTLRGSRGKLRRCHWPSIGQRWKPEATLRGATGARKEPASFRLTLGWLACINPPSPYVYPRSSSAYETRPFPSCPYTCPFLIRLPSHSPTITNFTTATATH